MKNNTQMIVRIGKKIIEGGFKKAYHSLPHYMLPEAKEDICRVCFWNPGTFNSKLSGKRPFIVFEMREIEKYFAIHNIDAWTGESLNK